MTEGREAREPRELRSDAGAADVGARMWPAAGDARRDGRARERGRGSRGGDGSREQAMVPRAEFRSYYGRAVLKPPVWQEDIAYYLFLGGLSAGSAMLAAGGDLTGRPALRRTGRVGGLAALGGGTFFLIKDLGRPERFLNMLRVAKPTSPMSVGTWILAAYGPGIGLAAASEVLPHRLRGTVPGRLAVGLARPAGLASALVAPAVAAYTAALLAQTAVPAWHEAREEMPFVFTGSAMASAAGLAMIGTPVREAAPARRLAVCGAVLELVASRRLEGRLGLVGEANTSGRAGAELRRASTLTAAGVLGGQLLGHRSRVAAALSGAALLAGGLYERLGVFHAGVASAADPAHTVVPQRQRLAERSAATGS